MTVADRDLSNYDGTPITLYEFTRRSVPTMTGIENVTVWRYTSADRDYDFNGNPYTAIAISDDGIRQSGDPTTDQVTFTMPATAEIPLMFMIRPPSDPIFALILKTHDGETDGFAAWNGVVGGVTRSDDITSAVKCNPLSASLDRGGLRLSYGRQCPHDLYGIECQADPTINSTGGLLTNVTDNALSSDDFIQSPDGILLGGFIEWINPDGNAERWGIIGHAGDTVTVMGSTYPLQTGDNVIGFRGCPHNIAGCETFANLFNYGGHIYMPTNSPFAGNSIF